MVRVLLTGATGFVGSHVLKRFLALGWVVSVTIRSRSNCWRIRSMLADVDAVINLDLTSLETLFNTYTFDCVVHLATKYTKHDDVSELDSLIRSNILFPLSLLSAAQNAGVPAFINTGTFFEYAESSFPLTETAERKPLSNYATTKKLFSSHIQKFSTKITIIELILFSPYGPADNDKLIPYLIKSFLEKKKPLVIQGNNEIDLVYVDDIAIAFERAVLKSLEEGLQCHKINIGSGVSISLSSLCYLIKDKLKAKIDCDIAAVKDAKIFRANITRAKDIIDWQPSTPLEEGLDRTIEYYKGSIY